MPVIEERLISFNRPGKQLSPRGVVIHSTANPGATALDHWRWWNTGDRQSSAHYVVDWDRILRLVPETEQAWHAGPTANRLYLGVEMCEPQPGAQAPAQFARVWNNTVWLLVDIWRRYGWVQVYDRLLSHYDVSRLYGETDHHDPLPYLQAYGRTMEDLRAEVARMLQMGVQSYGQRQVVAILDPSGRRLCEGWLDGGRTVVPIRDLAEAMGLAVDWDPGGPSVTLRWPGGRAP